MTTLTAEADSRSPVIKKCTSSGLIKIRQEQLDEENATRDVQALCQMFSREEA